MTWWDETGKPLARRWGRVRSCASMRSRHSGIRPIAQRNPSSTGSIAQRRPCQCTQTLGIGQLHLASIDTDQAIGLEPTQHPAHRFRRQSQVVGDVGACHGQGETVGGKTARSRSEEHTSELQSLMRISYAVFCLKKKKHNNKKTIITQM